MARAGPAGDVDTGAPFSPQDIRRFERLSAWAPRPLSLTPRRRRLTFLGLAAPGFLAVFATPLHHSFFLLIAGPLLFLAALWVRRRTEPLFAQAEAAAFWPPSDTESFHA